ncbi:MAG TPA: hypothetical protein VL651_03735 [Bacteroidia bacterium]|jgi:hypothetical protein|nr:hypothetical protein [Bacteroidia bacterium]
MENIIDKIDRYLDGQMSGDEKTSFESEMKSNPDLARQVQVQREMRAGIERAGLKKDISKTFRAKSLSNKIYKWGVATVAVVAIGTAVYFGTKSSSTNSSSDYPVTYDLPAVNETGGTQWADADKNLPTQLFTINPDKDTVIETQSGIVFAIPAHAFLNAKDPVTLNIREAVDPLDIIKGGLSTMSDSNLLQTGGMFCIDARNGETALKIDPAHPVYANVPTNEIKPGMMLFDGERKPDGSINWVNPKKMEKQLIPVDITTLDFYPKGFLAKVAELGFDANNKKVTDSIYYSYAGRQAYGITYTYPIGDTLCAQFINDFGGYDAEINPARIKAIWNDSFQNTIIATHEFEERLQLMFSHGNGKELDFYIQNLDKPLYYIDSLVMTNGHYGEGPEDPEFEKFYLRHDGGVAIDQPHVKKLEAYFELKKKAYSDAALKTYNAHHAEFDRADSLKKISDRKLFTSDSARNNSNLQKEFEINLTEACRQLGCKHYFIKASSYYSFNIQATGWKNIDMYVLESTVNRTTLDYTNPVTGKRAVIKYEELKINVTDETKYEQLMVYLLPDSLKSFMKVNKSGSVYSEKLNELFRYSLVLVGQKDKKWFYARRDNVKPGSVDISTDEISEAQLKENLETSFSTTAAQDFRTDIEAMITTHQYNIAHAKVQKQDAIDAAIENVIFPRWDGAFGRPITSSAAQAWGGAY